MSNHAGVAQGRTLNRILTREYRTQQQHSRIRKVNGGVQAIGEFTGVPAACACKIPVTPVETDDHIIQRRTHLVLVESQDASQHCAHSRILVLETLLPWHEQSGDDSGPVGREPMRATRDQAGIH
jgi:hypothetical protein